MAKNAPVGYQISFHKNVIQHNVKKTGILTRFIYELNGF